MKGVVPRVVNAVVFMLGVVVVGLFILSFAMEGRDSLDVRDAIKREGTSLSDDTVVFSEVKKKVTREQLDAFLKDKAGDALKDKADVFYDLGVRYDIDPAFAVAVARKETSLGKDTCQEIEMKFNNFFCMKYASVADTTSVNGYSTGIGDKPQKWGKFDTSDKGIEGFYEYIDSKYVEAEHPQTPGETQDTISKIGCAPGSGLNTHCYCCDEENENHECIEICDDWVGGEYSVPEYTHEIRNYAA